MSTFILVIHLLIALAMIVVILLQRSEGGALGIGGGSGGGLMSGRSAANLLTRTTGVLAGCFIVTSLLLAILGHGTQPSGSILDVPAGSTSSPAAPPAEPAAPAQPSVPLSKEQGGDGASGKTARVAPNPTLHPPKTWLPVGGGLRFLSPRFCPPEIRL